jgi:hypothetical protein
MVIPGRRWSPDCSARATAQRGQRRTADLIPDWLRFSTSLTLRPAAAARHAPRSRDVSSLSRCRNADHRQRRVKSRMRRAAARRSVRLLGAWVSSCQSAPCRPASSPRPLCCNKRPVATKTVPQRPTPNQKASIPSVVPLFAATPGVSQPDETQRHHRTPPMPGCGPSRWYWCTATRRPTRSGTPSWRHSATFCPCRRDGPTGVVSRVLRISASPG